MYGRVYNVAGPFILPNFHKPPLNRTVAMKTHRTLPLALLLCAAIAACGRTPTGTAAAPGQASYDSGFGMGSGNGVGTGDTGTMDDGTTQTDSAGRGGFTIGSGN